MAEISGGAAMAWPCLINPRIKAEAAAWCSLRLSRIARSRSRVQGSIESAWLDETVTSTNASQRRPAAPRALGPNPLCTRASTNREGSASNWPVRPRSSLSGPPDARCSMRRSCVSNGPAKPGDAKCLAGLSSPDRSKVRQLLAQILMQAAGLSVEELDDDKR
jgi:hypothetical protein